MNWRWLKMWIVSVAKCEAAVKLQWPTNVGRGSAKFLTPSQPRHNTQKQPHNGCHKQPQKGKNKANHIKPPTHFQHTSNTHPTPQTPVVGTPSHCCPWIRSTPGPPPVVVAGFALTAQDGRPRWAPLCCKMDASSGWHWAQGDLYAAGGRDNYPMGQPCVYSNRVDTCRYTWNRMRWS